MTRRQFARISSLGLLGITMPEFINANPAISNPGSPLHISVFSKHLQFLDFEELAKKVKAIGFDGVDLTVRPGGHIEPDKCPVKLPNAITSLKNKGLDCLMITTQISNANNITDQTVIKTASEEGVSFYRSNWFDYPDKKISKTALDQLTEQVAELSVLNKKHGIVGCYQNHSGRSVGGSFWELWHLLQRADPDYFGAQYDIRHAVVEGGMSWVNGFELLQPHIKTIVLKDFKWQQVAGKWRAVSTPIGQGMVDFKSYFKLLKSYNLRPPVSMHFEYPLGGAEYGSRSPEIDPEKIYEAMRQDLLTIHSIWNHA